MPDTRHASSFPHQVRLVIFGAGALARETFEVVRRMQAAGRQIECVGFLVDGLPAEAKMMGIPVLNERARFGGDETVRFCISIGDPVVRARIAQRLTEEGARFQTVLDPQVWIGATSSLGEGSIAFGHSSVTADSIVGRHVLINPGCTIAHDNRLDDFTTLSPTVALAGHVNCEEGAFVGTGASIRPNIRIGRGAYVGAGSVVVRDVEPGAIVVGNPARLISRAKPYVFDT